MLMLNDHLSGLSRYLLRRAPYDLAHMDCSPAEKKVLVLFLKKCFKNCNESIKQKHRLGTL